MLDDLLQYILLYMAEKTANNENINIDKNN